MKKCTFLFGAGADSQYGICRGVSFIKPIIKSDFKEERKLLLGEDMSNWKLLYPNSTKFFRQTILDVGSESDSYLGNDIFSLFKKYDEERDKNDYENIKETCKEWYSLINKDEKNLKDDEKKIVRFFYEKGHMFDSIDGKFNDLRCYPLHGNGKKVINVYYIIFLLMMKELYYIEDDFNWSFKELFDLLESDYKVKKNVDETYYEILNSLDSDSYYLATTNYTNILSKVVDNSKIVYLHGKLNWFENYKNLEIYDCTNCKEKQIAINNQKNILPFIFIPSGIKPIVSPKQLREYFNFTNFLDDSNRLCVVGYRFNSEDNHINAIIADWLKNEKNKLIYLNYKGEVNFNELNWTSNISIKNVSQITYENFNCEERIVNVNMKNKDAGESIKNFKKIITIINDKK